MFETGYSDSVTIKRKVSGAESNHNETATWKTIVSNARGEFYYSEKREVDIDTGVIVRVLEKLFINSNITIKSLDVAIVNDDHYDIRQVLRRRGFGGYHYELTLERRSHVA